MARVLDNIRSNVTTVTKRIYDGKFFMYEFELSVDEYLDEVLEALYDKHVVGTKGLRLRMARNDFLYGSYLATVSNGNGCRVTYQLNYKE